MPWIWVAQAPLKKEGYQNTFTIPFNNKRIVAFIIAVNQILGSFQIREAYFDS